MTIESNTLIEKIKYLETLPDISDTDSWDFIINGWFYILEVKPAQILRLVRDGKISTLKLSAQTVSILHDYMNFYWRMKSSRTSGHSPNDFRNVDLYNLKVSDNEFESWFDLGGEK